MSNKGKKYLPRPSPREISELRERYAQGDSIIQLATKVGRPYGTVRGIVLGRVYQSMPQLASTGCMACAEATVAAENVAQVRSFVGLVQCVRCREEVEAAANVVNARQGRIICTACEGKKN